MPRRFWALAQTRVWSRSGTSANCPTGLKNRTTFIGKPRRRDKIIFQVLFLSLYLFCIIMVSAFSARLTASLVVTGATPLIETFEHVNERKLNLYIPGAKNKHKNKSRRK